MPGPSKQRVVTRTTAKDGLTVITLNRPHVLNAINVELIEQLLGHLRRSQSALAIVIEGRGRAFCVGEDLTETLAPVTGGDRELRTSLELLHEITRVITTTPCPVIAAVEGYAVGGGAELALACDLTIAAPSAQFRFPEVTLGFAPGGGATARLPAAVGLLRAKELLLTGRWVSAEEAVAIGLANEVSDAPSARARALARAITDAAPPHSLSAAKRLLEVSEVPRQDVALQGELDALSRCFAASEAKDTVAAFQARRWSRTE